jgi:hypothetical protein
LFYGRRAVLRLLQHVVPHDLQHLQIFPASIFPASAAVGRYPECDLTRLFDRDQHVLSRLDLPLPPVSGTVSNLGVTKPNRQNRNKLDGENTRRNREIDPRQSFPR